MNNLQIKLKNMVIMAISDDMDLHEKTIDDQIDEIKNLPMFKELTSTEIEEVSIEIKSEYSVKLEKGVLIEEKKHERWFLSKKSKLEMKYWNRYKKYLLADKGFSVSVVNTMDDVLDTLTDLLGDPTRDIMYARKGLIIGDVQSGKTANYTGLICKAVDSGYKVIVLLTGTIERLRQQTQQRIDEGFVGARSDSLMKQDENYVVGVGKYDLSVRPMVLTSTIDDFKQQNANNLNFDLRNINGPVIFVIKKNSSVLKRLNKWLTTFNQNGDDPIDHSLLVIDDEADNASINTKTEDNPTAINGQIRNLLHMFTKSSYVGFTATPFANIFIDPDTYNDMVGEELFPKDYIYSLNSPTNYIGARNIFDDSGSSKEMLVEINDDETDEESIAYLLPLNHKSSYHVGELPRDMRESICSFLIANTIEDLRGMKDNHRSMLINVSRFSAVQEQLSALVNEYLKDLQNSCRLYAEMDVSIALKDPYISEVRETYRKIYEGKEKTAWEEIQKRLYSSCGGIIVQTINQRNGKDLSFDDYKHGLRLIAVGGMSLSRGLTLEGLIISYFYRNSRMYDTLMQMGRWFGYRKGYDDLCRIWMSDESKEWYKHISQSTDELRETIKRYENSGLTPMDFGLRVRSDITSLIVTAHNKMRSAEARECLISLSGECIETPEIYADNDKNEANYAAVKVMVDELCNSGYIPVKDKERDEKYGFKNIPAQIIVDLLDQLDISPINSQFNINSIKDFIYNYKGNELNNWDIAFASGSSVRQESFGHKIDYHQVLRSYSVENDGKIVKMSGSKRRLGTTDDAKWGIESGVINAVKELKSPKTPSQKDYFAFCPEGYKKRNPLLTIYVVDLNNDKSISKNETMKQTIVDEDNHRYIGFGIGIPELTDQETKYAKYVLNKIAVKNLLDGEIDQIDEEVEDE